MSLSIRTLGEEVDQGAVASSVKVLFQALTLLESQLGHVVKSVVSKENLSTWSQVLAKFFDR